jgi:16S rRNA (cytidine1402-2'-O)-methyltransferase
VAGTLYVVATPIGNLEDITLRAIRVLREVDAIASEDTRTTQKLLSHHGLRKPLIAYFQHSSPRRTQHLLDRLQAGDRIALVTEGGTPGVSDPGARLVEQALLLGIDVRAIPGPSSVTAAASLSGFPVDRFVFEGFLPRKPGKRRKAIAALAAEEKTLVFFESPHRVVATLREMADLLGDRPATVVRETTKMHEEARRGTLRSLADHYALSARGEFTLVVAGADRHARTPRPGGDESE